MFDDTHANVARTASTLSTNLQLLPRQTADSRGRPTVEVVARLGAHEAMGDVPAGASKGEDEAQTVPTEQAIKNITDVIWPQLVRANVDLKDPAQICRLDAAIAASAGENFCALGANACLPVSRALFGLCAALNGIPLHALLRRAEPRLVPQTSQQVLFLMNIFNGGLHALKKNDGEVLGRDRIDIQEIMVVPVAAKTYREALEVGERIDAALKARLCQTYGVQNVTRADEAGFSVKGLGDSNVAIAHVFAAIEAAGFVPGQDVKLALDVAASSFFDAGHGQYCFMGKMLSSRGMTAALVQFAERYRGHVLSIEDGLAENDWSGWRALTHEMGQRGVMTIGDDLFVTQLPRLKKGIDEKSAHAILIKVNQNGTVRGTLDVMAMARAHGMACIVSHRSGETLDDSIADLAFATGAFGLKTGDPQPTADFPDRKTWVRRAKYLRMVAIEAAEAGGVDVPMS